MNNRARKSILLLLGVFILLCLPSNSDAKKIRYRYIDLGTLGGTTSWSAGINNRGQVVGVSENEAGRFRAFVWTWGKMKDLGVLDGDFISGAWTINDRGQTVGFSLNSDDERRPVLWDRSGLHELETLGGTYTDALGINRHGEIVGWATLPNESDEVVHAVSWNKEGITDMNPFQTDLSVASSINTRGEMVGAYLTPEGLLAAVLWNKEGVHPLGALGGDESEAYWINDKGEAVGWCELPGGGWHACLWTPTGDTVDLGPLDELYSEAFSINNRGAVVGTSYLDETLETSWAFIWTRKGGMQDLNALVDLPGGVLVAHANGINDFGWIAGTTDSGKACILIPVKGCEAAGSCGEGCGRSKCDKHR
jgi:probable HAF family extracellular repeat protein